MRAQMNECSCNSPALNSLLPPHSGPPTPLLESTLPLRALHPQTSLCVQAPLSLDVLVSLRLQGLMAWGGRGCLNAGLYSESWPPGASLWPMGTYSARGQLLPGPPCVCEAVFSASVQTSCNWTPYFAVSSKRRAQPYSPEPGVSWGRSVFF